MDLVYCATSTGGYTQQQRINVSPWGAFLRTNLGKLTSGNLFCKVIW